MIDNEQISIPDTAARGVIETFVVARTFFTKTVAVIAEHFVPHIRFWLKRQIRATAIGRLVSPLPNLCKLLLAFRFEQ